MKITIEILTQIRPNNSSVTFSRQAVYLFIFKCCKVGDLMEDLINRKVESDWEKTHERHVTVTRLNLSLEKLTDCLFLVKQLGNLDWEVNKRLFKRSKR